MKNLTREQGIEIGGLIRKLARFNRVLVDSKWSDDHTVESEIEAKICDTISNLEALGVKYYR